MTRRILPFTTLLFLEACRNPPPLAPNRYQLTGVIMRLDEKSPVVVIRHEDILDASGKVWMNGMTMEFPVRDPAAFAQLKVGTRIKATLFQRPSDFEYWVAEIVIQP